MLRRVKRHIKNWLVYLKYYLSRPKPLPAGDKRRLLFVGHDMKFIRPIIQRLQTSEFWDIRILEVPQSKIATDSDLLESVDWAEAIFCEWGMDNAVWYSRHKNKDQILLVRVHLQEINTAELTKIDASKVDRWISIAPMWQRRFRAALDVDESKVSLVYNGIDIDEACVRAEEAERATRVGFVGCVPMRKRLDLALDVFDRLYQDNKEYELHIKGALPFSYPWMFDSNWIHEADYYQECFNRIQNAPWRNRVVFDGQGSDMAEWYSSMGWILSTSDFEGSHQAVAEGMAYGCIPVIRDWDGADELYATEPVFSDPAHMADYILAGRKTDVINRVRDFAQTNFEAGHVAGQIENLINEAWSAKHGKS